MPQVILSWVALFCLSLMLGACSSTGRSFTEPSMQETLETEILQNASKMFVYRLRWPEDQITNHVRINRGNGSSQVVEKGGVDVGRSTSERLEDNAAYVVKRMGYCREGFLVIDSSSSRYHLWLKGECKEGATDADKKQFGTSQILPVNIQN
jgi:hypothetical protein